jgi:nucleotide-binding universal stress UspA family protein
VKEWRKRKKQARGRAVLGDSRHGTSGTLQDLARAVGVAAVVVGTRGRTLRRGFFRVAVFIGNS